MTRISGIAARIGAVLLLAAATTANAAWQYDYFEGDWSVLPDFSSLSPVQSGTVSVVSTAPTLRNDLFALRFRNTLTVSGPGIYQFSTRSDDGSQLLIDGAVVVDNDGLHGATTVVNSIFLDTGTYAIEIRHFEQTGGEIIEVSYAPPAGALRPIPADGVLEGPGNIAALGVWGAVIQWPHVPVSAANLPDGRILTWASNERDSFPGNAPEFTFTAVWDPATGAFTEIDHPSHDMFCASTVTVENGNVFVSGGRNQADSPWTSVFDVTTDQWVPLNNMNRGRWYGTAVALPDGTIFTAVGSGGGNTGEVYHPETGAWQLLSGIDFNQLILNYPSSSYLEREWWPLLNVAPDGRVFHSGPTPQMHYIDTTGVGSATPVGPEFTQWYPHLGTTVMYAKGKLLTAGGGQNGTTLASTAEAIAIDLNGPAPVIAAAQPMHNPRKFHNGVMLPNGEVLVIGGNTSGEKFSDAGSILTAEIWSPATGVWREVADMSVPRNYHSIALLLTDGTVLSAGGGLCACAADHPDGQIYRPPYLYDSDGTPAIRPVVQTAPAAIRPGDTFEVATDTDVQKFSLIKMSSTTHAINTDLRYLNLPFTGAAGVYQLTADSNPNVLTPGYWMLFALNAAGTPSVARVIQVHSMDDGGPAPVPALDVEFASFADLSAFQLNGNAAGFGGKLRLTATSANVAGSAFYRTPVKIAATTSFSTSFEFNMNGTADGGEGLAFVVQGNASTTLGATGAGMGYQGIVNSLVVEIDGNDNGAGDPDGNHVAVHVNGDAATSLGTSAVLFDLEDGVSHKVWIDYDDALDELSVYLAENAAAGKPVSPLITVGSLDLPSTVGSLGYLGFTAATGSLSNNHDIGNWAIALTPSTLPLAINDVDMPPQPADGPVAFSASATGEGLQYSWSFGDGTPQTPFSSFPDVTHVYAAPGRYVVTLIVRDVNGAEQTRQFVQAVYPPLTPNRPSASNTIVVENLSGTERVWNVNPDNDTVTVINGETGVKVAEIAVGRDPRALAVGPDNKVWVTNKDDATITLIDTGTLSVAGTRTLPQGSRPHGIVIDPVQGVAYVALEALGEVRKLDVFSNTVLDTVPVGSHPRHLSLTGDATRLLVSRFITPPLPQEHTTNPQTTNGSGAAGGEVLAIDTGSMTVASTIVLGHSGLPASELTGPGFPNYLGPAIVAPGGLTAWVPSKQDNILRGTSRNGQPLDHDHTVRAVTSIIDLTTHTENPGDRIDHDNASVARNGAFGPYGVYLFVALEGNRQVVVIDPFTRQEILRFDVGLAPQSIAVSPSGTRAYVHNFMSRSVSIVDTSDLFNGLSANVTVTSTVTTTSSEQLPPSVLLGKQLFYDARDPRLARDSYMACASCHNDGGHDGRVWDLSSLGEGLRNTISLKGHGGIGQGPLHWSANFDEVQDFENQIRVLAGGTGLMSDVDFAATQDVLGPRKAGRSPDLDALAAYLASLNETEASPYRNPDGSLTAEGAAGKAIFKAAGCAGCHAGNSFTDSAPGITHDVGTLTAASGQRLGGPLTALDVPTLKGLWATPPYLHDGSAPTLRDAILAHDAAALGGAAFTDAELDSLVGYLGQIDDNEDEYVPQSWLNQDVGAVAAAGSFTDTAGTLAIEASGADIWGAADEFHFAYQTLDGDGEIVARLTGLANTDGWAKAGLMMRAALAADSRFVYLLQSVNFGATFQYRTVTGAGAGPSGYGDGVNTLPRWLKLVREGDVFTGYVSSDGITWTLDDSVTLVLPRTLYVGLAVTSHVDGVLTTATFDNVSVVPVVPPVPDTTPPSVPQNVQATATSPTTIGVSWSASTDAESSVAGYRVYRDGVFRASVAGTGFPDTGLTPSTAYAYTVAAFDTASPANESAPSAPANATTEAQVFVTVPAVTGQPQATAESTLTVAGLTVGTVSTSNSDTVAAGLVISQNPAGGASVLEGSAVGLVVSLGPVPVAVPDVVGSSAAAAITSLNNAGLTAGTIDHQVSSSVPAGNVISQDPPAGTSVAGGSAVNLVVSDGPPPPDVTPPTVPQNLAATAASHSRIDLSWNASSDTESGVAGYRIFRDGLAAGTTAGTTFAATGLLPNTAYVFTVSAFDAAQPANESAQSAAAGATTDVAPTWLNQDIGAVAAAGSFTETAGTLAIEASGADVWGAADELHYVYQPLTGDGEITARVVSLVNTDPWAKAGVMIRESLAADSRHTFMLVSAGNGADLQYRIETGGATAPSGSADRTSAAPYWVRLQRAGNVFTGYKSADGVTWVQDDQTVIAMGASVYIGLAVTSHNDGTITTAVFDGVSASVNAGQNDTAAPSSPSNLLGTASYAGTFLNATGYAVGTKPHGIEVADLNGDGVLDLATADSVDPASIGNVSVLLGLGDGSFGLASSYPVGTYPKAVIAGDFDNDAIADLASVDQNSNTVSILLGNGNGTFSPRVGYPVCSSPHELASSDLDGNGSADIVAACHGGQEISILYGNGNGTFSAPTNLVSGSAPHSVTIADFDGDNDADFAIANHGSGDVSIFTGNGTGNFQRTVQVPVDDGPHGIRSADLNGDGFLDLVTANDFGGSVSVLLGNGTGNFAPGVNFDVGVQPKSVAIGDLDGDGIPDLVASNTGGNYPICCVASGGDTVTILHGAGDGSFGGRQDVHVGLTPFAVKLGDLNADGRLDVATANWDDHEAGVLLSSTTGTSEVRLTWAPATDDASGVAGYRIYRNAEPAPLAEVSGTIFVDTDLPANTVFTYKVTAFDRASPPNESLPSNVVTVVTLP